MTIIKLLAEKRFSEAESEILCTLRDIIEENQCIFEEDEETLVRLMDDPMYSKELKRLGRLHGYAARKNREEIDERIKRKLMVS